VLVVKIALRNLYLGFRDQLPWKRLWGNFRKGNLKGFFHERSHLTHGGKPKIAYGSKASSLKACKKMEAKNPGSVFRSYKCLYCDGYHIGKNRGPDLRHPDETKWETQR
jgi:hypothetical protein